MAFCGGCQAHGLRRKTVMRTQFSVNANAGASEVQLLRPSESRCFWMVRAACCIHPKLLNPKQHACSPLNPCTPCTPNCSKACKGRGRPQRRRPSQPRALRELGSRESAFGREPHRPYLRLRVLELGDLRVSLGFRIIA